YKNKFAYIPYGVNSMFFRDISQKKIKKFNKKYDLPKNFLLYVGVLEPRKNIEGIIKAFSQIAKEIPEYKLLLVGRRGWYDEKIFSLIKESGLKDKVLHLGHIDYELLPHLYKKASIFLYPSFYEGFGMPVLESMAAGCPVITSNISSTKEVGGKGSYLINPHNIGNMAQAIINILNDDEFRENLIKRGLFRAQEFTWENTALKTEKLYLGVIND
ncbi:glycosyltransferase family 4 protein, partial [bacterium]|nr:glycosyltransferase family 4 protein [bacterium]